MDIEINEIISNFYLTQNTEKLVFDISIMLII